MLEEQTVYMVQLCPFQSNKGQGLYSHAGQDLRVAPSLIPKRTAIDNCPRIKFIFSKLIGWLCCGIKCTRAANNVNVCVCP